MTEINTAGVTYAPLPDGVATLCEYGGDVFTAAQMRAFADATYTIRASHGQAPAGESLRTDALCDLSYSHGLKAGWNYCASDDFAGFERAQKIGTEALRTLKSATAQAAPAAEYLRTQITGMSVSVDVSTDDATDGHRYFGTVTEVMECQGDKHGITLLVQDAEPNFKVQPAPTAQET